MQLGTDPEFFILDPSKRPVPAHRFFPGKYDKLKVGPNGEKAFRDGYAVELNVPSATCRESFTLFVQKGLEGIRKMLPPGYTLTSVPAVQINLAEDLANAPEDVMTFGCDPSWNAYTGEMQTPLLDALSHPWRYAGGHMHISQPVMWINHASYPQFKWFGQAELIQQFIRMCDYYISIPLTLWFGRSETFRRREHYGKAGEFRYQEYGHVKDANGEEKPTSLGCEYRTTEPVIWNAPPVASWAFGTMRWMAGAYPKLWANWDKAIEQDVRHAVNTGEGAQALFKRMMERKDGWNIGLLPAVIERKPYQELDMLDPNAHPASWGWDWFQSNFGTWAYKPFVSNPTVTASTTIVAQ